MSSNRFHFAAGFVESMCGSEARCSDIMEYFIPLLWYSLGFNFTAKVCVS